MDEVEILRQQIEAIAVRFGRWMTFIEIVQTIGFVLSMLALALLLVRIRKERKEKKMIGKEKRQDDRLMKAGLRVPCRCAGRNGAGRKSGEHYPAVNCEFRCEECGWNPEVKERRLRRMFG